MVQSRISYLWRIKQPNETIQIGCLMGIFSFVISYLSLSGQSLWRVRKSKRERERERERESVWERERGKEKDRDKLRNWEREKLRKRAVVYFDQQTGAMHALWSLLVLSNKCSGWSDQSIYLILFNNYCPQAAMMIGLGLIDISSGQHKLKTG